MFDPKPSKTLCFEVVKGMDENTGDSSSLPPFLTKTYEMVDDSSSNSIVSWSDNNNKSFIVKNPAELSINLLPRFFKHKNFSSSQLNTYGFRKMDPENWEFANDDFVRGQPYLMKNIHRRKPVHSHSLQSPQPQNPLSERQRMKDQIERLSKEKQVLLIELERQGFELQVTTLKDRLQCFGATSEINRIICFTGFGKTWTFFKPRNPPEKKKKATRGFCSPTRRACENIESSLMFLENLVMESCDKSMDVDVDNSTSCAESLSNGDDNRLESKEIDMNSELVTASAPKTRVNDVFWEQCLTENPGSIEQHEVQSERRDVDNDIGNEIGDGRTFWWIFRNVNNIAERA